MVLYILLRWWGHKGSATNLLEPNIMRLTKAFKFVALLLLCITAPLAAQQGSAEAPELGRTGDFVVGTSVQDIQLPIRVRLTATGVTEAPRIVGLRLWYPTTNASGAAATYRHSIKIPGKPAYQIVEQGAAFERALAANGRFPLVVISHGFGGWSEHLSRLGEHLASRGYVVAAIDHKDMPFDSLPGFLLSFGGVLVDRSLDQRQVIAKLIDPAFAKAHPALAAIDKTKIGLIGYSMGGYGALGSAGVAYNPSGKPFAQLPPAAKAQAMTADRPLADRLKAVVLIAPWGGQPDNRAWSQDALATLKTPTLLIAGDHDDIVNYRDGVRWLYESLTASDSYLLVYREARHNVAGNASDLGAKPSMEALGYVREPVWRQERFNQINQHFVTAFLDFTLKGDTSKRKYLDVPVPVSGDGKWPVVFGAQDDGAFAGDGQPEYWRGFQRRWAVGMELHHKRAGQ